MKHVDFPEMFDWQKTVLNPADSAQYRRRDFYEYYRTKFEICRECGPRSICEIGVRWGYSAFSFLWANPQAEYTGIDILAGTHGGVKNTDTFDFAGANLKRHFPDAKIRLIHVNSQQLEFIDGPYDFIHIDGDHSVKGAYHDLCLAFNSVGPGGHVLFDDYYYIEGVRNAGDRFLAEFSDRCTWQIFSSLRGDLLIKRKE